MKKRNARKKFHNDAVEANQCRDCSRKYCNKMKLCAYHEVLAYADGTVYECEDREEGNYFNMVCG